MFAPKHTHWLHNRESHKQGVSKTEKINNGSDVKALPLQLSPALGCLGAADSLDVALKTIILKNSIYTTWGKKIIDKKLDESGTMIH